MMGMGHWNDLRNSPQELFDYVAHRSADCWVRQIQRYFGDGGIEPPARNSQKFKENALLYERRMKAQMMYPPPSEETLRKVFDRIVEDFVKEAIRTADIIVYKEHPDDPTLLACGLEYGMKRGAVGALKEILADNRIDADILPSEASIVFTFDGAGCFGRSDGDIRYIEDGMFTEKAEEKDIVFYEGFATWRKELSSSAGQGQGPYARSNFPVDNSPKHKL